MGLERVLKKEDLEDTLVKKIKTKTGTNLAPNWERWDKVPEGGFS